MLIELNVFMKSLIKYFLVVSDVVVVGPERLILKPGLWYLALMWTGTLLVRSKGVHFMFQTLLFNLKRLIRSLWVRSLIFFNNKKRQSIDNNSQ